jgi:hypothetical protein
MLIGGMIGHKVQNELEVTLVCLLKQSIQILKCSEGGWTSVYDANIVADRPSEMDR